MLLHTIFLWLLCIVLFSLCSTTLEEKEKLVQAAVKALKDATTTSEDPLADLSSLGPKAAALMNAFAPIGAMALQETNWKPPSEEPKVAKNLENRTEKIRTFVADVDVAIEALKAAYSKTDDVFLDLSSFGERATQLIKSMIPIGAFIIDAGDMEPTSEEYKALTDFNSQVDDIWNNIETEIAAINKKSGYHSMKSAREYLNYLRHLLVDSCKDAVTPEEAQKLADRRDYFVRLLLRLRVRNEPLPDVDLYFMEFLDMYEHVTYSIDIESLDVFQNNHFSSYHGAIQELFKELHNRGSIHSLRYEFVCLQRSEIFKSNFNYEYAKMFVAQLKSLLIQLTYLGAVCASVSHHDIYSKNINDNVALISSFTSKFLNDSLTSAWPSAHNAILQEQILRTVPKRGYIDDNILKKVANLTYPQLINTGIPNHVYEMVIVRGADKNYEFFFDGIGNHCSFTRGSHGFDTIIGRIPLNSDNRDQKFDVARGMFRRSKHAEKLNVTIQFAMDELFNAATLPIIADTLKKKIGKQFITQQDFHCWAIARKWSYWSCPTIDYWSSPHNFVDLSSVTTLRYRNKGRFYQSCEEFRFFFM